MHTPLDADMLGTFIFQRQRQKSIPNILITCTFCMHRSTFTQYIDIRVHIFMNVFIYIHTYMYIYIYAQIFTYTYNDYIYI